MTDGQTTNALPGLLSEPKIMENSLIRQGGSAMQMPNRGGRGGADQL